MMVMNLYKSFKVVISATVRHVYSTFDPSKNSLTLNTHDGNYFKVLSDDEHKSPTLNWTGIDFAVNDPGSLDEALNNYGETNLLPW